MKRTARAAIFLAFTALIVAASSRFEGPLKNVYWTAAGPLTAGASALFRRAGDAARIFSVSDENRRLRVKLENVRRLAFEREELRLENERLKELLGFRERLAVGLRRAIVCRVIGRSPAGWRDAVILDRGQADGIRTDMPVMSYLGLLGRVIETRPHYAKVRLITHPRFRVGALTQRSRHTGVVTGTPDGECRMKYIAMDADVAVGDVVETAGFSEGFPKGLLIGTIDALWKEPGQIYRVASVHPAADIDRLEEVLCVVP